MISLVYHILLSRMVSLVYHILLSPLTYSNNSPNITLCPELGVLFISLKVFIEVDILGSARY